MHRKNRLMTAALVVFLSMASRAEEIRGVLAVLPIDASDAKKIEPVDRRVLEEGIRTIAGDVLAPLGFRVMTGDNMLTMLAENGIDPEKACNTACALETARELNTTHFVSGSLSTSEGEHVAYIKLYESKSNKQLASVKLEGKTIKALRMQFETKASEFFSGVASTPVVAVSPSSAPPAPSGGSGPVIRRSSVTAATADLTIDAKPRGGTRLEVTSPDGQKLVSGAPYKNAAARPGRWTVVASANGYVTTTKQMDLSADEIELHVVELDKPGSLEIRGRPAGAAVTVSGPNGFRDEGGLPWAAEGLTAGSYRVTVSREGYDPFAQDVVVAVGRASVVEAELPKKGGAGAVIKEPKTGYEFVPLPAGMFMMGCLAKDSQCDDDEKLARRVWVRTFALGKYPVTVEQYAKCANAGACSREPQKQDWGHETGTWKNGKMNHPVNSLTWDEARRFCEWIGGRLPMAEEWEYAAKSGEERIYPWGDEPPTGRRANYCDVNCVKAAEASETAWWIIDQREDDGHAATSPVGSYPAGATMWGLLDMAGNVWEWTASKYDVGSYELRGGGWNNRARWLRATSRDRYAPTKRDTTYGVRCALSR